MWCVAWDRVNSEKAMQPVFGGRIYPSIQEGATSIAFVSFCPGITFYIYLPFPLLTSVKGECCPITDAAVGCELLDHHIFQASTFDTGWPVPFLIICPSQKILNITQCSFLLHQVNSRDDWSEKTILHLLVIGPRLLSWQVSTLTMMPLQLKF